MPLLSPQQQPPAAKNVLIVEDSRTVAFFMKNTLEQFSHFHGLLAHSMTETHDALAGATAPFFAAILDLNLPDAPDGEVVDLVLQQGIPAIVLTSLIDNELRQRIEAKGVANYVLKSPAAARQVTDILLRLERNQGVKILLVEDSGVLRRVTRDFLERQGFHVLEAANGQRALDVLEREKDVPLVITDYEMPQMDGFELCRKIREQADRNSVAIIGMSSRDDELLSARLLKAGANDFLPKPFQREELYTRIVNTLETLEYIAETNRSLKTISSMHDRMKRDLEAAAKLQRSLLPEELPRVEGVQAASAFFPCDELAGDTYSVFGIDEQHLGLYVLDVSGHGVPAALLSVTLSRVQAPGGASNLLTAPGDGLAAPQVHSPATVCSLLNEQFPMNPDTFQYFTIAYAVLDRGAKTLRLACAGHPGPVLLRADAPARSLKTRNMAIGFSPEAQYRDECIDLQPGDRLYFYTDGIVEAKNAADEEYGLERLCAILEEAYSSGLDASLEKVYDSVQQWNAGSFNDDVTLLALEITPELF